MKFLRQLIAALVERKSADDLKARHRREALYLAEAHCAAAEHHQALATMYMERVRRIDGAERRGKSVVSFPTNADRTFP